jgi:predicted kinase
VLRERVRSRSAGGSDASEADLPVLERQLAQAEPLVPQERAAALDVDTAAPLDVEALATRWLAAG